MGVLERGASNHFIDDFPKMQIAFTLLGCAMIAYCLMVRMARERAAAWRLIAFWLLLIASVWLSAMATTFLAIAGVLIVWHWIARLRSGLGAGTSVDAVGKALESKLFRDRERAIRQIADEASPEGLERLIAHLEGVRADEDEDEMLTVFRAFIDGWGAERVAGIWADLPDQSRMDFLEFAQGCSRFAPDEVLEISRRGMEDEHEEIARRAWRTYAYTVTAAVDRKREDFDFANWSLRTQADANQDIQGLRCRLEQRFEAEAQNQNLDALVSKYRNESFITAKEREVSVLVPKERLIETSEGSEVRLPAGTYKAKLGGEFDNAQNAVIEGWTFALEMEGVEGKRLALEATWPSGSFFGAILESKNDEQRFWFEDAPDEVKRAYAMSPFVGPVVAYDDIWDLYEPRVNGEPIALVKKQVLSCLMALVPGEGTAESQLACLLYEIEDAHQEGDEVRPFVTLLPVSRWFFDPSEGETFETLVARTL